MPRVSVSYITVLYTHWFIRVSEVKALLITDIGSGFEMIFKIRRIGIKPWAVSIAFNVIFI